MMLFLQIITGLFLIFAVFVCFYHLFLALAFIFIKDQTQHNRGNAKNTFAILIPAHNEENTIRSTINSCFKLDYPTNCFKIYIIADNCTDSTASIAREMGVTCLVRDDLLKIGKGYALEWAIPQVLSETNDAVIVLDADCHLSLNALQIFDYWLEKEYPVLQANYVIANPNTNSGVLLLALANHIENQLFYTPKSYLKLSVFLRGTGMVFRRDILAKIPWHSRSLTEDAEYSLRLIENKVPIMYLSDVQVFSDFPISFKQLAVQRARWVSGGMQLGKKHAFKMIKDGLSKRNLLIIDAGVTILLLSRPSIIIQLILTLLLAITSHYFVPGVCSSLMLAITLSIFILYLIYVFCGAILFGMTWKRLLCLVLSPFIIGRYLIIAFKGFFISPHRWERTPRTSE